MTKMTFFFLAIAVRERPGGSRIGQSGEDLDFFIGDEAFGAKGTEETINQKA